MTSRDERIRDLFMGALDQPEEARLEWLARETDGDEGLRAEVLAILRIETKGFLRSPVVAKDPAELVGQNLGPFELLEVLGRGGMGVVFRAGQKDPRRDVAVKVLRAFAGDEGERRFDVEIASAAKLDHPGIVRVISAGEDKDTRWYAMDLVRGPSLARYVNRESAGAAAPEESEVARIMAELLDALQHAHDHNVVHRDVKPGNVLLDEEGRVRLTDFGLARDLDRTGISLTDQVAGTLSYMSPEQARALKNAVDWRTDVYSAGALMYALLTGEPPHSGASGAEVLASILGKDPRPLNALRPDVDRGLAKICSVALRRHPDERYPSAHAMAEDLRRWLRNERAQGRPLTAGERMRRVRLSRRSALWAVPAAALLGGTGSWAIGTWFGKRRKRVPVKVTLGAEDTGADFLFRESDGFEATGAYERIGTYGGPGTVIEIPAMRGRLTAVIDGRWVSFDRVFQSHLSLEGICSPAPSPDDPNWALLPSGSVEAVVRLDLATGNPIVRTIDYPALMVARKCVANGAFRSWSQSTGGWSSPPLESRLLEATERRSGAELARWDRLPMTSVNLEGAQAFGEAGGFRLPTSPEWQGAVEGGSPDWLTRKDLVRFRMGLADPERPFAEQQNLNSYASKVAAVDDPRYRLGPLELFHPIGNIAQWTTSPGALPVGEGVDLSAFNLTRGRAWYSPTEDESWSLDRSMSFAPPKRSDWSTGVRLIKEARLPI